MKRVATWAVVLVSVLGLLGSSVVLKPGSPSVRANSQGLEAEVQAFIESASAGSRISPLASGEAVALALNAQIGPGSAFVVYVGDPALRPFRVPAGQWWLFVLGTDGRLRQSGTPIEVSGSGATLGLGVARQELPGDAVAQAQAMRELVHFALSSQLAAWLPLAVLSEARASGAIARSQYDSLDGLARALAGRREAVLRAADTLGAGSIGLYGGPEMTMGQGVGSRGPVRAAPNPGIWDRIKDSFTGFFLSDAMTGASARKDIEAITQNYSPSQREELFQIARQRHPIDAENAERFFARLRDGAYDSLARQLHQDFIVGNENYTLDAATGGRRPLDTAARDGAQLVKDGAQFYADVVKTVLGARFGPDFDKGWELAQRIADRLTEVDKALQDPLGYAQQLAQERLGQELEDIEGNIKDKLKEKIQSVLSDGGLSEADAERLAGQIADRVADAGKDRLQQAAQAVRDQLVATGPPPLPATSVPAVQASPTSETPGTATPQVVLPSSPTATLLPIPTATSMAPLQASAVVLPGTGPQGTGFQLMGRGFLPGEQVLVTVASPTGSSPGVLVADDAGSIFGGLQVGANDPTGTYTATLVGATSGARATASFFVTAGATATPRLQASANVSPGSGPQGSTFQLMGAGFLPGEQILVTVVYPGGSLQAVLAADASGFTQGALQVAASDPTGTYTATLAGSNSGARATASFVVTRGATPIPVATAVPTAVPATPTPSEPYGVFVAGDDVLVGRRSEIENTPTCSLRGWGLDCTKKVRDVTTVTQVLGPYSTYAAAQSAYCSSMVPGSLRTVPLTGGQQKARFTFDGKEHWVTNAPAC